jgi:hypothetical protein
MPAVAAAAAIMEATKLPLREARRRYKRSELAIMSWRSSELAYNMGQRVKSSPSMAPMVEDAAISVLEQKLGPIGNKITNESGEVDLGQLTGEEAMRFFDAMGIQAGRA